MFSAISEFLKFQISGSPSEHDDRTSDRRRSFHAARNLPATQEIQTNIDIDDDIHTDEKNIAIIDALDTIGPDNFLENNG
jgi:hypothetical protein